MRKHQSLTSLLKDLKSKPKVMPEKDNLDDEIKKLQLSMLRIQQGVFHKKDRVIIMFEGFDAAGKGGAIRTITEVLDPRSFKVIPIGPPTESEAGKHFLYRFWKNIPAPGNITIFDRSWYGRVLVEKVDKLADEHRLKVAHREINEFEAQLVDDGIVLIKFFLAITKDEQLERFEARLKDPYKQWKITMADVDARKKWDKYVAAVDEILKKNNTHKAPWKVIPANSKKFARREILRNVKKELHYCEKWIEKAASKYEENKLAKLLKKT